MHPHLLEFGRFSIPTYGVIAATGLILGLTLNARLAVRDGLARDPKIEDKAWNLGLIAIVAAILGCKVLLVITDWSRFSAHPSDLLSMSFLQSAGVYYGGLIAAILASFIYMRMADMPFLRTCDAFAPGVAFGHGLGRLGCLAAGCCFGKPTDLPWGITFTDPLANSLTGTPLGIRLHPTQMYEFLTEMLITVILLQLWKHRRFSGQVIGSYAFLYGFTRYFLELVRDDPERGSMFGGAITITQFISIFFVIAGGALWLRRQDSSPPPTPAPLGAK